MPELDGSTTFTNRRQCRELLNLKLLCKLLVITQMLGLLAILCYLLPILIQNVYSQQCRNLFPRMSISGDRDTSI